MAEFTISNGVLDELSIGNMIFDVQLSAVSATPVTVFYRTLGGTAHEDIDFRDTMSSITIAAGDTTGQIVIDTFSDSLDEADENFVLELYNPDGATFANGENQLRATGVILDNDGGTNDFAMFISDPILVEGDSGQKTIDFEIRLSSPALFAFTATYATQDGSAIAGQDYVADSGTLNFAIGQEVATVSILVNGDSDIEPSEQFSLIVAPQTGVVINRDDLVGVATINDDDASTIQPVVSISDGVLTEQSIGNMEFVVSLSQASATDITVDYRTIAGTADEDIDFRSAWIQLTIPAGDTSASIVIDTFSDSADEGDENLVLELVNPVNAVLANGATNLRATGVILDNDGATNDFALFVSDPVLVEGDAGQSVAIFEIRLSTPAAFPFTVNYTTQDGSAVAGQDYTAQSGNFTFAIGQTLTYVTVEVNGDTDQEGTESFSLAVTPPNGLLINASDAVGQAIIQDDDASGFLPTISVFNGVLTEQSIGNMQFVVSLSQAFATDITVSFRTLTGTADEDIDFRSTEGTVTIPAGATSVEIVVDTFSDSVDDADENFILELTNPVNAVFAGGANNLRATGVILDNDGATNDFSVFVSDPVLVEADAGQTLAVFEVRLSQPAPSALVFDFQTQNGTATAGSDYVATSGMLNFALGQEVAYVSVAVNGDTSIEATEQFSLTVTPPVGLTINTADATSTATIQDDDASAFVPVISVSDGILTEQSIGELQFTVSLSQISNIPVTVQFVTRSGTATDGNDYRSTSGTLTFAANTTSQTITVDTFSDSFVEIDETFILELFNPAGAVLAANASIIRGTGTILNNDPATNSADTYSGTFQADTFFGFGGNDLMFGNGGDDVLDGGSGADTINGNDGNDTLFGQGANDAIDGGNGADQLFGQANDDQLFGGAGNDLLNGGGEADQLFGQGGNDELFGGSGNDLLNGGGGADMIFGQGGNDQLIGGNGADTLDGGGGADTLFGDADNDILRGNNGNDTINGGAGADSLFGQLNDDTLNGGGGNDLLIGGGQNDILNGQDNDDRLFGGTGDDQLFGGGQNDVLAGNLGADTLDGGTGDDDLFGDDGNDTLRGNIGQDLLDGGNGNDQLFGQENNDRLLGNNGADFLNGGSGNDELFGQADNDVLIGGAGNDLLAGGGGTDTFQFLAGWGDDVIADFANGIELINMSSAGVSSANFNVSNAGGHATVDFGGADSIKFLGQAGNIDVGDFTF